LEEIGLEGRRVQMINISSAMGGAFAESVTEMSVRVSEIGPNPLNEIDVEDNG